MDYIIKNGTVVNEGSMATRDLFVHEGRLVEDSQRLRKPQVFDAAGCYVLPGIIDTHVHFRDPGFPDKADFASESRAALAGGVTSVIDMPNTNPQTTSLPLLEEKEHIAAQKSAVNYAFMLGATNDNIEELLGIPADRYAAVKLFLGSSTGNMLVNKPETLDKLFSRCPKLIVAHCEDESIIQANMRNYKLEFAGTEHETAALHPKIRNTEACFVSTYKAIERARKYGTRLHIAHLSTATELSLLSNQSLDVKHITAEVTPNHLWFDDRDYAELGNLIKCNPAIKTADDRLALWSGLIDGTIDTIATDHAPHTLASKQLRYFDAPGGIPSIQHSLQMMLEGFFNPTALQRDDHDEVLQEWLPLIVAKMCHNPATIFGIQERGFIRPGYYADLVVVEPGETQVTHDSILYKCGWSPLEGQTFHTRIRQVFLNGMPASQSTAMKLTFKS
ncbi:MAG: dihydroorotase [Bacteroidales bacterium]|nr:dihydroorotase [Bacteroidales bacterium]